MMLVVCRTASGFNRWLRKNNLKEVEAKKLAELIADMLGAFESRDRRAASEILNKICKLTRAKYVSTCVDVAMQFVMLCNTFRFLSEYVREAEEAEEDTLMGYA